MGVFFGELRHTRGARIFLAGVVLVLIAPLPLVANIFAFGNHGNPAGFGLLFLATTFAGASVAVAGCVTFTIDRIARHSYGLSIKSLQCITFGLMVAVVSFIIAKAYLELLATLTGLAGQSR